jgi:hypothetical protein
MTVRTDRVVLYLIGVVVCAVVAYSTYILVAEF